MKPPIIFLQNNDDRLAFALSAMAISISSLIGRNFFQMHQHFLEHPKEMLRLPIARLVSPRIRAPDQGLKCEGTLAASGTRGLPEDPQCFEAAAQPILGFKIPAP